MLFESLLIILLKTIFCQYHNFFIAIFYLFFWCENALAIKLPWVMINNNHNHTYQFCCPCNRNYRRIFEKKNFIRLKNMVTCIVSIQTFFFVVKICCRCNWSKNYIENYNLIFDSKVEDNSFHLMTF